MKNLRKLTVFITLFCITLAGKSQISGVYNIPGSTLGTFPNIAAAITTLNAVGVAGAVTINIAAGYTENAPFGGYKLFNVPGASVTNTIVFRKSGTGANPLITAFTGTASASATAVQDGVWWFIGADYITIDGIDITDPNTTNPATMEFGYGLYRQSLTNGCQFNTIKNCAITLNRINTDHAQSAYASDGSRGIDLATSIYNANHSFITPTSSDGSNSYNKIYGNRIENCHVGISLMAYQAGSFMDYGNDVGGLTAVTGNTVINFGGGSGGYEAYGINTCSQRDFNISNNYINNNNGSV